MQNTDIYTGTVTYAIKGRDLLRKNGFKSFIERSTGPEKIGCGYKIVAIGDSKKIMKILNENNIKVLEVKITN